MSPSKRKRIIPLESLGLSPAAETTVLAALVGILAGFGVIVFKNVILFSQNLFWHTSTMSPAYLMTLPWWYRLLIPALGGLIVGPLIYLCAKEAEGNGVPEVIEAVVTKNSIIRPVVVLVKIIASALTIGSGGSVGREGPIVQIGAAIGSSTGQLFRLRPVQMKTIVGCGVAAGISSTFNAPIAGTLFALELIVTDFGLTSFTPIIVAAVTSTAITRHFQGNTLEFVLPQFQMVSLWELFIYVLLGCIAGVVGYSFSRFLYVSGDAFKKIAIPKWLKPAVGGLLVGAVAIAVPHILGVGYDTIHYLFEGHLTLGMMVLLVAAKIITTSVTVGSGGSGGVFSPSLYIGAMLGGAFGMVVNLLFPEMTGSVGAYALVGMAAVNSACTLAPLSAIIILIELTSNYGIILPLMLTVVIATFVSRKFSPESIYTRKLARKGIQLHMGEDLNILRAVNVTEIIRHDESVISADAPVVELVDLALNRHRNVIFVVDRGGHYKGLVTLQALKHALSSQETLQSYGAITDLIDEAPSIRDSETLDTVVTVFGDTGYDRLPVLDRDGVLVGSVIISDLMRQYNLEVSNRNIAIELGAVIHDQELSGVIQLGGDIIVTEVPVPAWAAGKTIGALGLRKEFNVSVFLVREAAATDQDARVVTPGSSHILREGDTLLIGGRREAIDRFADKR